MSTLVGEHAQPQAQDDRDVSLADTSTELGAEQAVAFFLQALERRWGAYVVSVRRTFPSPTHCIRQN